MESEILLSILTLTLVLATCGLKSSNQQPLAVLGGRYATYRYEGGLTTPTCNEVVRWINMEDPLDISREQLAAFR